jgi:hypothetical protein
MRSDTTPAGSTDLPATWGQTCDRIIELVRGLPDGAGYLAVPTVPGTTVRDVMAHLISTAAKAVDDPAGLRRAPLALPAAGGAEPGARLAELVTGWAKSAEAIQGLVGSDPDLASVVITSRVRIVTFDQEGF